LLAGFCRNRWLTAAAMVASAILGLAGLTPIAAAQVGQAPPGGGGAFITPPVVTGPNAAELLVNRELFLAYDPQDQYFFLASQAPTLFINSIGQAQSVGLSIQMIAQSDSFPIDLGDAQLGGSSRRVIAFSCSTDTSSYFITAIVTRISAPPGVQPGDPFIDLVTPLSAVSDSGKASAEVARLLQSIRNPIDVINFDYNKPKPRPPGLPLPPNYAFPFGSPAPICPPNLPCVAGCECAYALDAWQAQQALYTAWAACDRAAIAGNALCVGALGVGGAAGAFFGPLGAAGGAVFAYLVCIATVAGVEQNCKEVAGDDYATAMALALAVRDGCVLACPGWWQVFND